MPGRDGSSRALCDFIRPDLQFDPDAYLDDLDLIDDIWSEAPTSNEAIAAQAEDPYSIIGSHRAADFRMLNLPADTLLQPTDDSIIAGRNGGAKQPGLGPAEVEHMTMSGPVFDDMSPEDYEILLGQLDELHMEGDIFSGELVCDFRL